MWPVRLSIAVLLLCPVMPSIAFGQPKAGVVTTLEGTATATRSMAARPVLLKPKDDVLLRDRIETAERSFARVLLGGKAVLTIRERSAVTITEAPGLATIDVDSGKMGLAVARERMQPGELIEIRTPTAIVGVRGTVIVTEVACQPRGLGGCEPVSTSSLLQGSAEATRRDSTTGQPVGPRETVQAFESFRADTRGSAKGKFTAADVAGITAGLQPSGVTASDSANRSTVSDQLNQAAALVSALFGQGDRGIALLTQPFTNSIPKVETASTTIDRVTAPPVTPVNNGKVNPVILQPVNNSNAPPTSGLTENTSTPSPGPTPSPSPIGPNLLDNGGFETGTFAGWSLSGAGAVIANLGSRTPPEGQFMALIHTGTGSVNNTTTTLTQSGSVGSGQVFLVRVTYKFLSNEFPSQSTIFNDTFIAQTRDPNNQVTVLATESRNTSFSPTDVAAQSATAGGFTIAQNNGETPFKTVTKLVTSTGQGLGSLEFTIFDQGDASVDSAALIDDTVVALDPPLHLLRNGASLIRTDPDPLERFVGVRATFDAAMIVCCGSAVSLRGPLLEAVDSDLTVPFTVLGVMQGGSFTSTTTAPLVSLERGTHALGTLDAIFDISGVNTAIDGTTGLTLGVDTPLRARGSLLEARGADITTERVLKLDTALLEASLPVVALKAGGRLTSNGALVDLTQKASITALAPLASLDQSSITIRNGAALQLAGGSAVRVTGDLFDLRNGSRLTVLNGALVSVTGGSLLNVSGALIAFNGTGGNLVSVTNNLCPCTVVGGIPVALQNGALASNVSIGARAIKNPTLGSVQLSPNAALISVSGPASKVSIAGGAN